MSEKNMDNKNRWRNKGVSFRMSPEESRSLDSFVKISGLSKQDYIIRRVLVRDIVVRGNPRIFKALRDQLREVLAELKRIETVSEMNEELIILISQITDILKNLDKDQ